MLKTANLALRFLLELCAVLALAVWGFITQNGWLGKILWGIGAPAVMILIWSAFIAPKARNRLPDPLRLLNELVLFGLAALALTAAGFSVPGQVMFGLYILNLILSMVWGQRQRT